MLSSNFKGLVISGNYIDVKIDHLSYCVKTVIITHSNWNLNQYSIQLWKSLIGVSLITKSFQGHSMCKNYENFSPAAGIYWLIKIPVLPLVNPSFKVPWKTASDVGISILIPITKSFLGHFKNRNYLNFSPAAGMYWLLKLPVLPINPSFKVPWKTASDVILYCQIASRTFSEQKFSNFFRLRRKSPKWNFFWATWNFSFCAGMGRGLGCCGIIEQFKLNCSS